MKRYKNYNMDQILMILVCLRNQLIPGTFEYALNYLIDKDIDLSIFNARFKNDLMGAPAYHPALLLKVVLFAYSRGVTSSRKIQRLCEENIIFMALACGASPHYTTIANFVTRLDKEIGDIFKQVLLVCDESGLIGKEMFAIDGCKLPSNASKEWSGTHTELEKKAKKMDTAIDHMLKKHRDDDNGELEPELIEREKKQIEKLTKNSKKIKRFLKENNDRLNKKGKPVKSNITDNESAKMKTPKGVIQGYCGLAVSDDKKQVIITGEAIGSSDEFAMLQPMVEMSRENFREIRKDKNIFEKAKLSGDAGFCSEENLEWLDKERIDAYIADGNFRKRDPRFATADRHKPRKPAAIRTRFKQKDFKVDLKTDTCICPSGKKLWVKSRNAVIKGHPYIQFKGHVEDCKNCSLRKRCLSNEKQKSPRTFNWSRGDQTNHHPFTQNMIKKIDSEQGRHQYSRRLGIIEPVFGNIASTLGLNRFSLRGKLKVNTQWLLFCITHNIGKIQRYGSIPI